jgi:imidazolonepropionase-like amidohydrolase
MRRPTLAALLLATLLLTSLLTSMPSAASDSLPATEPGRPVALVGATVHTVTGPTIAGATVLFDAGVIRAVGVGIAIPPEAERLDLPGRHIYPGLIDGASVMGLEEIGSIRASLDHDEVGDLTPEVRVEMAWQPDSEHLPVARANGLTHALSMPTGGLVAGQAALLRLDGWTTEDLVERASVALVVTWPSMNIDRRPQAVPPPAQQQQRRDERLGQLSELLADARQRGPVTARLRAVQPILSGEMPILVIVSELRQVQAALDWAAAQEVRLILAGSAEFWRAADELTARDVPVIYWSTYLLPGWPDAPYDASYDVPRRLHEAGVTFCLAHSSWLSFARNLSEEAARAVAYGLPAEAALRALTIAPARIFGVDGRLGSIEVGKEASLIVTDGDLFEITSRVEHAFIAGRAVDLSTHHTRLYDKYRARYERLGLLPRESE